jgi:toxin ParE1/3/4
MAVRRREVRWAEPAEQDLWAIIDFIDRERPLVAEATLQKIRRRAQSLRSDPQKGRRVPEFARLGFADYRELVISVWRLIYRLTPDEIEVVAIFDGRRNFADLLLSRLTRE